MTQPRVHLSRAEPTAFRTLNEFSKTVGVIARENGIDERLREIVLLHISQLNGCAYCARIHVARLIEAGGQARLGGQAAGWRGWGGRGWGAGWRCR